MPNVPAYFGSTVTLTYLPDRQRYAFTLCGMVAPSEMLEAVLLMIRSAATHTIGEILLDMHRAMPFSDGFRELLAQVAVPPTRNQGVRGFALVLSQVTVRRQEAIRFMHRLQKMTDYPVAYFDVESEALIWLQYHYRRQQDPERQPYPMWEPVLDRQKWGM